MTKEEIKEVYKTLLLFVKSQGYRVTHRKLHRDIAGLFDPDTTNISIDRRIRGDIEGCYTLCHEYTHAMQFKSGQFKEFFALDNYSKYSEYNMHIIEVAEKDAARGGARILHTHGVNYKPQELTISGLALCRKFWKKHYFEE